MAEKSSPSKATSNNLPADRKRYILIYINFATANNILICLYHVPLYYCSSRRRAADQPKRYGDEDTITSTCTSRPSSRVLSSDPTISRNPMRTLDVPGKCDIR